jgi:hypothetical protein
VPAGAITLVGWRRPSVVNCGPSIAARGPAAVPVGVNSSLAKAVADSPPVGRWATVCAVRCTSGGKPPAGCRNAAFCAGTEAAVRTPG